MNDLNHTNDTSDTTTTITTTNFAFGLHDLYEAFARGDLAEASALVRDDCVLHVPGIGANAGDYWGKAGFQRFMSNILAYGGGVFDLKVPVVSITGADAFTREVVTLNRSVDPQRMWTLRFAMHYRWKAGGLSEIWVVPEDQRLYDEYWSRPFVVTAPPRVKRSARTLDLDLRGATSPTNLAFLSHFYDLFWRGDMDALEDVVAPDVTVNITGRGELSGMYFGWDGYMRFRDKLVAMVGSKYKLEADAIVAGARDGWVKEYIRMDRAWDPAVRTSYVLMHFTIDDGRITSMDDFPLDTYTWERDFSFPSLIHVAEATGSIEASP